MYIYIYIIIVSIEKYAKMRGKTLILIFISYALSEKCIDNAYKRCMYIF